MILSQELFHKSSQLFRHWNHVKLLTLVNFQITIIISQKIDFKFNEVVCEKGLQAMQVK